jgi:lipopolysaccharide export system permease protein
LLKELVPQFLSGVVVFCAIIVVSQLVRLSDLLVQFGLSAENVLLPFLYLILPFLSLTIPIAFLFAVLITFSRLSADGEYPAMLASGFSLRKAAMPVLLIATLFYGVATACALNLEPWGRRELVQFLYRKTQTELDNYVRYKMHSGVFLEDFIGYVLYAEKISDDRQNFENVLIAPGKNSKENFTLLAPSGSIVGSVEEGELKLELDFGVAYASRPNSDKTSVLKFKRAEIDLLKMFQEQILGDDTAEDDFRSYTPTQMWNYLGDMEAKDQTDDSVYKRARYLLHQRIAMPFSTITFAMFGMILGVSDPRRGKSWGYVLAIATTIGGFILSTGFRVISERGAMEAPLAAWAPNFIMLAFGIFLMIQKNRLPPSEGTLEWSNMPWAGPKRF